jgi:Ca-activated chloride channel family protein
VLHWQGSGRVKDAALLLVLCVLAYGQTPEPVFRNTTTLQSVPVRVIDRNGNDVDGLTAADFTLLDNGKPQKIAVFSAERTPVSLAVLLDISRSMDYGGKLKRAQALLAPLLRGNRPEDEIFFMPFTDRIEAFEQVTAERRSDPLAFKISSSGRGTAFYDALASALCHLHTARNVLQAIVIITDGADQHSRLNLDQVIALTQSSNAQIFTIGLFGNAEYEVFREREKTVTLLGEHDIDNPVVVFERLSKESGAESFFPRSDDDLQKALQGISAILQAQYTLAYYPPDPGRFRRIEVKVRRRGVRVLSRSGAGGGEVSRLVHFAASSCEVSSREHPYPWEARMVQNPSGVRIYREDFSDPATGWPNRPETGERGQSQSAPRNSRMRSLVDTPPAPMPSIYRPGLRYVTGGYEISRKLAQNTTTTGPIAAGTVVTYGPSWDDFRASATVETDWSEAQEHLGAMQAGLVFGLSGSGYCALLLSGTGTQLAHHPEVAYEVVKKTLANGSVSTLIPWTKVPALNPSAQAAADIAQTSRTWPHKLSVERRGGEITVLVDDQRIAPFLFQERELEHGLIGFGLFGHGRAVFRDLFVESLP